MKKNNVKLLVQRYRSATDQIQNSSVNAIEAHIHRDGLRAVDSGEFLIPTGVPVSEGDIVKWIQDDADVTHLRSCYMFQGSLRDEGGWEADGENTYLDALPQTARWGNIGLSEEVGTGNNKSPAGANKFKGLLRINTDTAGKRYSNIPNKLMYVNKTVSSGTTTANVHDFDGDFEIDMWITAPRAFAGTQTLFAKLGASNNITGQRIRIYMGSSGQIQAEVEDGSNNEVTLTTGSKVCKVSAANFIRFQRKGSKFSLWLVNGSELSNTLFSTPDVTSTDSDMESITSTRSTYIGNYEGGSQDFVGLIHSVRIYCGGVLNLDDARALYKARAAPLVMKLAGTVWKIKDMTKGKKLFVTGFGKVIPQTIMDTNILDSSNHDSAKLYDSGSLNRTLNVYKTENAQNIIFSLLKMLNKSNTDDASGAATAFNKIIVGNALSTSDTITEFIAEGNLLSLIKILLTRAAAINQTYSFFISPRGVCVLEDLGIDRGITFNHNPYNIQVSAGDDTFTVNDLTVYGRIPTITSKLPLTSQGINSNIDISSLLGKSIPLSVRIFDSYNSGVDAIIVGKGGNVSGAPIITLAGNAAASISDYDGNAISNVRVDTRGNNYTSAPTVVLSGSHTTNPILTSTISGGEWLENNPTVGSEKGDFIVDREGKTINIKHWNDGSTSGTHNIEVHIEHEDIVTTGSTPNLYQKSDPTSITNIGRYRKRIFVPQLTNGVDIIIFATSLLSLSKNINKRYTIKAPFLVNFVRENHKVTVKNTIKNINATGQIVKSIHWHYPKNETIIEVGEHEANAYDLVVRQNETVNSLTAQSLKSMNR
jgi:hypothetical protein